MGANVEIERKFRVLPERLPPLSGLQAKQLSQFYLGEGFDPAFRVRIVDDAQAWLTIKGRSTGLRTPEFEYEIPLADAREMAQVLRASVVVEKTRYLLPQGSLVWELDVFAGANAGLVIAEIELDKEDHVVDLPDWCGAEVSTDPRFKNINLALNPYRDWRDQA